ncbi:MAG: hypothetical protein KY475_05065 [Planctomycetes bacterium]|nr:hypothetical protein [Planctomycetota bacterium]
MNAIAYVDRLLDPMTAAFTPELARKLVDLKIDPELERHVEALRAKANAGALSPEEESDYHEFIEAVDVVSIIQSKARRFLAERES